MRGSQGHILNRPVIGLDIDGTLGKYHEQFHWFAEMYVGRRLEVNWDNGFKGSFNKALGLSKPLYREVKLAYRQSGLKRAMEPFEDAAELSAAVKKAGAQVWVCTTRPYQRLDNVDPDTKHWLKRNGIKYDHLLFGPSKYRDLVQIVGKDRIVAVVDDLPEQHIAAHRVGVESLMPYRSHNSWWIDEAYSMGTVRVQYDMTWTIEYLVAKISSQKEK